ncbi:MAG: L,D-transpeptidase [Elusimicrobia bacterium]|nr:L,D-transpeptidase [Elusimicrobiota bacterium]
MSENHFGRTLYPLALSLWTAAFAWRACGVARDASALGRDADRLEDESRALDLGAMRLRALVRDSGERVRDARFLQDIPNILPEDKGYLRTQKAIEGEVALLRAKVAKRLKNALHLVIDARANKLYVKKGAKLLWQADVSVGRGGVLKDAKSGRSWEFATPRGEFRVIGKSPDPQWRKPDWAYVEAGEPVPPPGDPSRMVSGELGAYVLNLGDGYLIHGTKREELLGRPASHGCVRVGAADLERLYAAVPNGTRVFIFQ